MSALEVQRPSRRTREAVARGLSPGDELEQQVGPLKIVDKAMRIPLVADAVVLTKSKVSPLVESVTPMAAQLEGPMIGLKNRAEEILRAKLPEEVKTNVSSAVASTVANLDSLACKGLDHLTESVPVLKSPTPEVLETSKEVAMSCVGLAKEYMASFTIAQMALKLSDVCLDMVDSTLKETGLCEKNPVSNILNKFRRETRAMRRAGMKRRGGFAPPAKSIGEVSMFGAVCEILGVNFFLSAIGLVLVPRNKPDASFNKLVDVSDDEEALTVQQRLSPEKLDAYESDKDPDYAPTEESEDSLEYDSDAEVEDPVKALESGVVYEDEHAKVIAEDASEQEPVVVDTEFGAEETKDVVDLECGVPATGGTFADGSEQETVLDKEGVVGIDKGSGTTPLQQVSVTEGTEKVEIVDLGDNDEYVGSAEIEESNTPLANGVGETSIETCIEEVKACIEEVEACIEEGVMDSGEQEDCLTEDHDVVVREEANEEASELD